MNANNAACPSAEGTKYTHESQSVSILHLSKLIIKPENPKKVAPKKRKNPYLRLCSLSIVQILLCKINTF